MTPLEQLRRAMDEPDGGFAVIRAEGDDALGLWREAARNAGATGFVPVMADHAATNPLPDELLHRHVLLICPDAESTCLVIPWLRALAFSSPRRHLLVTFGGRESRAIQHDGATTAAQDLGMAQLQRAERWLRQGRGRAGERWLVAAAAAADRRGDTALAARVRVRRATWLLDEDRVAEADRHLNVLLRCDLAWSEYQAAAVARADVFLANGQLDHARAWISSLEAEASLRGVATAAEVRTRWAELDFWQGRHADRGRPANAPASADELGWRALAAWTRTNSPQVTVLTARLAALPPEAVRGRWWVALLRVACGTSAEPEELGRRIGAVLQMADAPDCRRRRWRRLAMAVAGRAWIARGEPVKAAGLLQGLRGPGPEATTCARLLTIASARVNGLPPTAAVRSPRQLGMDFLASGSTNMHLVDGLSGLLAVVEDSEDDAAVLTGGCRWVCRQSGASAVALVSADGTTLVAAEGWKRSDLAGEIHEVLAGSARDVRQPGHDTSAAAFGVAVRYGGATIGHVVARGRPSDRPALQQAVMALAALCGSALRARLDTLTASQRARESVPEIVGDSLLMRAVREAVVRAASAPFPVLIEGESGTGKELVARAVHRLGPRRDHRLSAVNCAALTDDLVEAELFGHTRGAFTGAVSARAGLFEEASGGTLFLDEVTELSPRAQAKLLRVLQEREIRRVGENTSRPIDVRVIAACNLPLAEAVAGGRFRDDLRFRLAVVQIHLPALRDRLEDLPLLAHQFWRKAAAEAGTRAMLGGDALARLARHNWPGNVRELQNVVAGLVVAAPRRGRVSARQVDQVLSHTSAIDTQAGICLDAARRSFERRVVAAALVRHAGRRSAAAVELGLTRQGLTKALRRLGLGSDDEAAGVA